MLSPSRLKKGCSATYTTMYKSPDGPPKRPTSPFPGMRTREPAPTPGGKSTSTVCVREKRPSPPHSPHRMIERPVPPQSAHVTENCRCPFARVVFAVPPHVTHVLS